MRWIVVIVALAAVSFLFLGAAITFAFLAAVFVLWLLRPETQENAESKIARLKKQLEQRH